MIVEMRPFTRRAVSVLVCHRHNHAEHIGGRDLAYPLATDSGEYVPLQRRAQPFADVEPPPVSQIGSDRRITLSAACSRVRIRDRRAGASLRRPPALPNAFALHILRCGLVVDLLIVACEAVLPSVSAPVPAITASQRRVHGLRSLTGPAIRNTNLPSRSTTDQLSN